MRTQPIKYALMLLTAAAFYTGNVQAQITNTVVTTAVPFLRISPDAIGSGMGETGIATTPDANSSYWNLAKTPFAKDKAGVAVTYTPWLTDLGLNDVYLANLAGYYKIDDQQAIGWDVRYFSLGSIQFTDDNGTPLSTYRPRESAIDFGYSRKLSSKLSLGVALSYIHSDLAYGSPVSTTTYKPGNDVSGNISLFHKGLNKEGEGLNWGITVSNLGPKIGYSNSDNKDYIPANLGVGAAYTTVLDESNKITFALDLNKLLVPAPPSYTGVVSADSAAYANYTTKSITSSWFSSFSGGNQIKEVQASFGAEYSYLDQFFFRAGYFYEDQSQGNRRYATFGLGLKYEVATLNFSYIVPSGNGVTRDPLSNTVRFTLAFHFDDK